MLRRGLLFVIPLWLALALAVPVTFTYDPPAGLEVRSVSLRGSFNQWGEIPMLQQPDGTWSVTVELPPGPVQYKFFINGRWPQNMCDDPTFGTPGVDAEGLTCRDDGQGGMNAVRVVEAGPDTPPADTLAFQHDPQEVRYLSVAAGKLSVRFGAAVGEVRNARVIADQSYPMLKQLEDETGETWRAALPVSTQQYRIQLTDKNGKERNFGPFRVPAHPFTALDWVSKSVGYQIFLERFWNGDPSNDRKALQSDEYTFNPVWQKDPSLPKPYLSKWSDLPGALHCCHQYFGGDLAGFMAKLPYLKALGTSLVYFNPLFDSGSVHGYDTHDYLKVSPKFGDTALLQKALEAAHKNGLRVIFDFVPNHTGLGFWAFQDVVKKGRASKYWNWYFIRQYPFTPGDSRAYEAWAGVASLPKLNTGNLEVRRYLIGVAVNWIKFGFDGVRVDVANEVIDPHGFFRELRQAIRRVNPEAYLVAEVWQRDPSWLQGDEFDSLMNYAIGRDVLLGYARGLSSARRTLSGLSSVYSVYSEAVAAQGFNLIGSHDTARVLTDLGGGGLHDQPSPEALARLKLASALLYALPGVPVYFQGEECGFTGEKGAYPVNELYRYPLQWERCNPDTLEHYRRLGRLRTGIAALRSPVFRIYRAEGNVLAFFRGEAGASEALVVFNSGKDTAQLPLPQGGWRDAVSGKTYRSEIPMEPISWRYLQRGGP